MKKKILGLLLGSTFLALSLFGCGAEKPAEPAGSEQPASTAAGETESEAKESGAAKADGEKIRIALMMSHQTNAFTKTVSEAAVAEGEKEGVEVTVFDGKKDVATQISQIQSVVSQKYDGILIEPLSIEGVKPGIEMAKEAGIPVITCIQKIKDQEICDGYVGGNDKEAGRLQMEKIIEALGGKGKIALLYGPMGGDAQLIRKEGYDEALKDYPDVEIVFETTANWVTDEALKVTENWLASGKEIDAIVSQNDSMAIGAAKAVTDAGKGDQIIVAGIDATPDGLDAISKGTMLGTISQDTPGMGARSVETMVKLIKGEEIPKENLTEPIWITKDNVDEYK